LIPFVALSPVRVDSFLYEIEDNELRFLNTIVPFILFTLKRRGDFNLAISSMLATTESQ